MKPFSEKVFFGTGLVLITLVLVSGQLIAQRLPLRAYTSADGMASSVIHQMARDSKGFIWFAARGGLSRWDGSRFVKYRIDPKQSAPLVHYFAETRDGTYWISTDEGLYRVKPEDVNGAEKETEQLPPGERSLNAVKVSNSVFWVLFEDSAGRLWAGMDNIYLIENRNDEKVSLNKVPFKNDPTDLRVESIRSVAEAPNGELWFSYASGVARRFPSGRFVTYEVPRLTKTELTFSVRLDSEGLVWFSHHTGVFVLKPGSEEESLQSAQDGVLRIPAKPVVLGQQGRIEMPTEPNSMLRIWFEGENTNLSGSGQFANPVAEDLFPDENGTVWVPSQKSIFLINKGSYQRLTDRTVQMGTARHILNDPSGDLWIGTFAGVFRYSPRGVITFDQTSGMPEPTVHSIARDREGNPLIFHGTWYVSGFANGVLKTTQLKLPDDARFSWTSRPIYQDPTGDIWALTVAGLYRYPSGREGSPTLIRRPEFNGDDRAFYRAFSDSKGNSWFAARGPGGQALFKYEPQTDSWSDMTEAEGYPKKFAAAAMAESVSGDLWFGFYQLGGIYKYTAGRFVERKFDGTGSSGSTFGLEFDRDGRLWIGTVGGGVVRITNPDSDNPEVKHFTESEGLTSNNVRSIEIGADGSVYAGTIRGVSRIEPETDRIEQITVADGLAADFVHDVFEDSSGEIWFGTANGLSRYTPQNTVHAAASNVYISDVNIDGAPYKISQFGQRNIEGFDLASDQNDIEIGFHGAGSETRFRYLLEGSNNDTWSAPVDYQTLNFANLSPGSYRLLIRSVSETGIEGTEPAVFSFTIRPPFWRTWWFIGLCIVTLGCAVFALDRFRVKKTRQAKTALALSQESENRFRTLANTASDAIITIDEDSQIIFVNEAVEKVFGYAPEELIGQKMPMLMPERMREGHYSGIGRYVTTGRKNINWSGVPLPGLHKDGTEIPLEVSFGEFERDGKRFFTGIARDVSERRRAELALQEAREERFRELERVRTRIATDLHDDIGSSLTQIAVLSEVARSQAATIQTETASTPLDRIKTVSRELVAVMSDIVWAINPQKDNLNDLVMRMRRFGSDVFSSRGIGFEFAAPGLDREEQLGANIRREVFAIFKESVNNAAKYSECTQVKCELIIDEGWLRLSINDNGKGFDTAEVLSDNFRPEMGGNGLVSIRRRAKELAGRCDIWSQPGNGTTIDLNIPLNQLESTIAPNGNGAGGRE